MLFTRRITVVALAIMVLLAPAAKSLAEESSTHIRVAVCYDPNEWLGLMGDSQGVGLLAGIVAAGDYLPTGYEMDASLVTYQEVANGALMNDGYEVAYFYGGLNVILFRPGGFDDAVRQFVSGGGGLVTHCGAAAAMSKKMRPYPLPISLTGSGILPLDANIGLRQLLNLVGRTAATLFSKFLAPVDVVWVKNNVLGLEPGLMPYVWDGGVSYTRLPPEGVKVQAYVLGYDVHAIYRLHMLRRPFFMTTSYGNGKISFCPGSPEFAPDQEAKGKTLASEVYYVMPSW